MEPLVAWFRERDQHVSFDEGQTAGTRVGGNKAPWLTWSLWWFGYLSGPAFAKALVSAWNITNVPLASLTRADWREMFDAGGYTVDGVTAERPTEPERLYRGCRPEHRRGWSWTPDPILAHWFAKRPHVAGLVYEALLPPDAMLARLTGSIGEFRSESEVIVDTRGVKVVEHRCSCPRPPSLAYYLRTNGLSSEQNGRSDDQ